MAMRQDCRHFESQTFAGGDTLSKCTLNLAPEAPWRCPTDCASYERRRVNVNLEHQKLASSSAQDTPSSIDEDSEAVADLLADVASIVDEAAPDIVREVEKESRRRGWRKLKRKSSGGKESNRKNRKNRKRKKS